MDCKEEKKFRQWLKKEKRAERYRKEAMKPGIVCAVCGKTYHGHNSYGEVIEHRDIIGNEKQWVKE